LPALGPRRGQTLVVPAEDQVNPPPLRLPSDAPTKKDGRPYTPRASESATRWRPAGSGHTGDADLVREAAEVRDADVLPAPIGGGSVMTPEEAADAVMLLRPKIAVPIHYTDKKHYVKFRDVAHPYANVVALRQPP